MAARSGPSGGFGDSGPETPEERAAVSERLDRVAEEKRRALAEPGPSWREWWFHDASKWYLLLVLLIGDLWLVTLGVESGGLLYALVALVGLLYVEFLLYRYLWYRPRAEEGRPRGAFRRTWLRPVRYGRWTPEADLVRAGGQLAPEEEGPDLREFA